MEKTFDELADLLQRQPFDWRAAAVTVAANVLTGLAIGLGIAVGLALAG
ncbi:hypothetical protein ACG873_20985 [Mesorhizobium sp. AaZ16]